MGFGNRSGIILTISLIFVIVITIIAGICTVLTINQSRIAEHQIKRLKAHYTAEAALVAAFEDLRKNGYQPQSSSWEYTLTLQSYTATVKSPSTGPVSTRAITASVGYFES